MKIKIGDIEIKGKFVEITQSAHCESIIIDLDDTIMIDPNSKHPDLFLYKGGTWTKANIDQVPTAPKFNRIIISTDK